MSSPETKQLIQVVGKQHNDPKTNMELDRDQSTVINFNLNRELPKIPEDAVKQHK